MISFIIGLFSDILSMFGTNLPALYKKIKDKKFHPFAIITIILILMISFYIWREASISVTSVTIDQTNVTMKSNGTLVLHATVLYSNNSTDNNVLWSSSDTSVAAIDSNGTITALTDGETKITAQASRNNTTEIAECNITVKSPPTGYTISVHQTSIDSYAYVYVTPYDDDITKIQIFGKSPSGEVFTPNKDENDLYHFYKETGTWTIYASLENSVGVYEAHKPSDFATIEVTNTLDLSDTSLNLFDEILQYMIP